MGWDVARRRGRIRVFQNSIAIVGLGLGLSGCVAAAFPIMEAMAVVGPAISGFVIYKSVQTSSGGSVDVAFASPDGKKKEAMPMPAVRRIAVWPGDEGDAHFAQRLSQSGRYTVVGPESARTMLAKAGVATDLKKLTDTERDAGFQTLCRRAKVDFVFASHDLGSETHTNTFSFSRANVTAKADLLGYSCASRTIAWRDQVVLTVGLGGQTPSSSELATIGSDAWADRVLNAPKA